MSPLSPASFIAITDAIVPAAQSDIHFFTSILQLKKNISDKMWTFHYRILVHNIIKTLLISEIENCVQICLFFNKIKFQIFPIYCLCVCVCACYLVYWSFPLENVSKMKQILFVLQRERESWDFCLKIQFGTSLKRQGQEQEKIQFWTSSKRQQEEEGWRRISVENPILMQHQALPVGMKRFETDSCTFAQYQKTLQPWFFIFLNFYA